MFIGCFLYSFIIGALTSLLLNVDSKRAQYQESLRILVLIKKEYNIADELFSKINKYLKYDMKTFGNSLKIKQTTFF
jgi:ABC-type sulfate transport system substrate-binding protein